MREVRLSELTQMDREADRCAEELSDADCDVIAYACLIAVMSQGGGYHSVVEERLSQVTAENGRPTPVVSSAGALVDALLHLKAERIGMITPYIKPLTRCVTDYLGNCGVSVVDSISLEVPDNLQVGRLEPRNLIDIYKQLQLSDVDALVLSACVQMPSLPVIQKVEEECGLPVVSAATATVYRILTALSLDPVVPDAGRLLSK